MILLQVNLIFIAVVILVCIVMNKISAKIGIPMLFVFIVLGMIFGSDGILKVPFDNFKLAEEICSVALIFIMFYGGFGTKLSEAKPVAGRALLLSSVGVIFTTGLTGAFCYLILQMDFLESFLIGAVLSSTDAATVFSILRSKRLNLKYNTASLLEIESGSNDPFAYMLTVTILSMMSGRGTIGFIIQTVTAQLVFGILCGAVFAVASVWIMEHFKFPTSGFDAAFVLAIALLSYAVPITIGGNGYLSVYIVGIALGNRGIPNKKSLIHFFDGITGLMQMTSFFLLGLLAFPSQIPAIIIPALAIALFITFVARPIVIFSILSPMKSKISQMLVVSWTGIRGAASIVFAIMAIVSDAYTKNDVFHITFCVVLFSIALQGSLLPFIAKKANMLDKSGNVLKTFNDYSDETEVSFLNCTVEKDYPWIGKTIKEIVLPPDMLLVMIIRNNEKIIPNGDTMIEYGDRIIISAPELQECRDMQFHEIHITEKNPWNEKKIASIDIPTGKLIIMIKRGDRVVIPNGDTIIKNQDILVLNSPNELF